MNSVELRKLFEEARAKYELNEYAIRSCWKCNPAHEYLKNADYLFHCIWCGHWFYKGVDLTEAYEEVKEDE